MDVNAVVNEDGGIFATACCKTATIGKQPVSFFENFKHTRSFADAYPDEAFMQQVAAQIVWQCQCNPISQMPSHLLSLSNYVELPKMDNNIEYCSVAELKRQKASALFLQLAVHGQLTRALPENLISSLPGIEEFETELSGKYLITHKSV
ncbi:MAG TPA: hypothetical protein C5S50_02315 [Methanosarcinaceae archaeon]|nr:hypothetical protein [Methanosarcinaceae archaeon]